MQIAVNTFLVNFQTASYESERGTKRYSLVCCEPMTLKLCFSAPKAQKEAPSLPELPQIPTHKTEREREREGVTDRQSDRPTDRQTDRPTDRQTDRQTDRVTHTECHKHNKKSGPLRAIEQASTDKDRLCPLDGSAVDGKRDETKKHVQGWIQRPGTHTITHKHILFKL